MSQFPVAMEKIWNMCDICSIATGKPYTNNSAEIQHLHDIKQQLMALAGRRMKVVLNNGQAIVGYFNGITDDGNNGIPGAWMYYGTATIVDDQGGLDHRVGHFGARSMTS